MSDGGIWNNLATQPFEDGLLPNAYTILVADASAPISRVGYRRFQIPAVAEIAALVRQGIIQNTNTVDPRRDRYRDRIRLETILPGDARFKAERLCVVSACVDTPRDVVARFRAYSQDRYKDAVGPPTCEGRDGVEERIEQLLTDPRLQQLQQLALPAGESWGDEEPVATFGTTLGKVPRDIAVALVGRGYANTAVTLYLSRLVDELAMPSGWLAEHAAAPR